VNDEHSTVRVGVDVTEIAEVADSLARFGDRYRQRLFTEHELESCPGDPERAAPGLAARFAAKEAALKVLRPRGARPEWRSIEVWRHADGWCDIRLHGGAARLAREQGIYDMAVSLTHDAGIAAAAVVAQCHVVATVTAEEG
jgi:holo-[acyl-carrier protein] synthase